MKKIYLLTVLASSLLCEGGSHKPDPRSFAAHGRQAIGIAACCCLTSAVSTICVPVKTSCAICLVGSCACSFVCIGNSIDQANLAKMKKNGLGAQRRATELQNML